MNWCTVGSRKTDPIMDLPLWALAAAQFPPPVAGANSST